MGSGTTRTRRAGRALVVAVAVLAASLALARYGDGPLAAVASMLGLGGTPEGTAAALAGLGAPSVLTALVLRSGSDRGLRAVLGGLALVGASVGAGWLTGPLWTAAEAPLAILLTYGIGLAGVVLGYLLAATDTDGGVDTYDTPSYVRDDPDPITTLDGGRDDDDLQFFLDDEDE